MLRVLIEKPFFHLVLIAALGLIVYSNTFNVPFQWDDKSIIAENPVVKNFDYFVAPSKAKDLGVHYVNLRDRYVGYLTFAVNYRLHGLDVRGYHVVNISLHILNAFLVYFLVRITFMTPFFTPAQSSPLKREGAKRNIALFSALFFVSHPIQTEAVTYIMGRLPLLMSFFYLSSIVLYAKWRLGSAVNYSVIPAKAGIQGLKELDSPKSSMPSDSFGGPGNDKKIIFYLLSLLSAVLAMKTKENAFTLPFAIAMYEFFFFGRTVVTGEVTQSGQLVRNRFLSLLPFMLTLAIIPMTRLETPDNFLHTYSLTTHVTLVSRVSYLFTQFRVLVTYLGLLVFPVNQNFLYDYPVYNSFPSFQVAASFIFLLSVFIFGIYMLVRSKREPILRVVAFGIFWFYLTLSVESSIFPIYILICEYRLYLPSAGIFAAVLTGGGYMIEKTKQARFKHIYIVGILSVIVLLVFAAYSRNNVWSSKITLWEDVVRKSPNSALAHYNLGLSYKDKGMFDKAIMEYQTVLSLNPYYDRIFYSLATAYVAMAQYEHALPFFKREIEVDYSNGEAHLGLGYVYMRLEEFEQARKEFEIGLEMEPDNKKARKYLDLVTEKINKSRQ